jgi:hypothetical protein
MAAHVTLFLFLGGLEVSKAALLVVLILVVRVAVVDGKDDLVVRLLAARKIGLACLRGRDVVAGRGSRGIRLRQAGTGRFEVVLRVTSGVSLGELIVLGICLILILEGTRAAD